MRIATNIGDDFIENKILQIRGQKVMLDSDLAELFGVDTKVFNQSVKRNVERFPEDFMFELSISEWENLRSHFVTSSWGGARYRPRAFTEQGVAMLSAILKSKRAVEVHIRIIRIFIKLRKVVSGSEGFLVKLQQLEKHIVSQGNNIKNHDRQIDTIFALMNGMRNDNAI